MKKKKKWKEIYCNNLIKLHAMVFSLFSFFFVPIFHFLSWWWAYFGVLLIFFTQIEKIIFFYKECSKTISSALTRSRASSWLWFLDFCLIKRKRMIDKKQIRTVPFDWYADFIHFCLKPIRISESSVRALITFIWKLSTISQIPTAIIKRRCNVSHCVIHLFSMQ